LSSYVLHIYTDTLKHENSGIPKVSIVLFNVTSETDRLAILDLLDRPRTEEMY